jgi:hypothetical protein
MTKYCCLSPPKSTKVTSVKARKLDSWIPLFTLLSCTPGDFHRFHYLIIAGSVGKVKPTSLTKEWGDTLGYMLGSSSKKLEPATIPVILPMNPAILPTSTDINPHLVVGHSLVARALPSTKEDLLQGDNAAPDGVKTPWHLLRLFMVFTHPCDVSPHFVRDFAKTWPLGAPKARALASPTMGGPDVGAGVLHRALDGPEHPPEWSLHLAR